MTRDSFKAVNKKEWSRKDRKAGAKKARRVLKAEVSELTLEAEPEPVDDSLESS